MKAAIAPAVNQTWELKNVKDPKPRPNQVVIKIKASGLCFTDIHQTKGELPGPFPRTLGHEPVGEIVEIGTGVTTRKVGDRVGVPWVQSTCKRCEWCLRGKGLFCMNQVGTGVSMSGGHAELMLAWADGTVLLPQGISYEQAAPVFCAGYTVYSGLRWAEPQPQEKIAVVGIGGLGHLGVQYAKACGYTTIAVSHSPDKDASIREMGADTIVRNGQELAEAGGVDIILATSNSISAMTDTIKGLRPDGRFVLMGFDAAPVQISPADLIMKRIKVMGSQQNRLDFLYEALDFVATGKVKVKTETYKLDEILKAYDRVSNGKARFRAVITN